MSVLRHGPPGATRICPHCRATILESASVCPACRHHLRVTGEEPVDASPSFSPFTVEGTIRHPPAGEVWEYSVLLSIRDDRGNDITRQVVGVGALHADQQRTFTLAVQVFAKGGGRLDIG